LEKNYKGTPGEEEKTMSSRRVLETYPSNYRTKEIKALAYWIRAGESGSIIGLAGAGKSNLIGFLSRQSEVMMHYLKEPSLKLALILVDLNNLPGNDLATLHRVILRSLYEACGQLAVIEESLPATIQDLYRKVEEKTDPFVSQSALREALFLFREKGIRLVLMLDPFDPFCQSATTQVLDNLRGLRDSFKATLSYIVGLRHELAYIRDPIEIGELYEILDTHVCWLGAMERDDARWVISQVEEGMGQSFGDEQIKWLINLTGGYPALLRAASLWLARVPSTLDRSVWEKQLLTEPSIQNRLNDLWQGLTGEEQAALSALQMALAIGADKERRENLRQTEEKHQYAFARLQTKHLCTKTDTGLMIFSPLFTKFIAGVKGTIAGKIGHDPKIDRFFRGERELTDLSEQDRRLLRHFLDYPLAVHSVDDLIDAAWTEYDSGGVSNAAVQQAIRHLRKRIELNPAKPCYLTTQHGSGYRFFPEGAPQR
jgi:hypothetical protein